MRAYLLGFLLSTTAITPVMAQELSLDDAVQTAVSNNPAVHAARERALAAGARADQARGHRWFNLDLSEMFSYSNNPAEVFAMELNQRRFDMEKFFLSDPNNPDPLTTWITRLELTQPIYTGGKLSARIGQAESMASAEDDTLAYTLQNVTYETVTAYVNLAKAREHVGLLQKARETTAAHVQLAEQYAAQGMVLEADVLQAQVYLSQVEDLLQQASNGAVLAQAALNFQMGTDQLLPRSLAPLPPPPPVTGNLEDWIASSLQDRNDLAAARKQMEAGKLEEKAARSGYLPEIAAMGHYDLYDDTIFGSNGHSGSVMAVAKINLWRGGSDKAALTAARHESASFAADVHRFEEGVRLQTQQAWNDLQTARSLHATAKSALAAARESLRVRESRFKQGLDKMLDLLDAETALREAEMRELVARYDVVLQTHRLYFVTGATPISTMEESS